MNIFPSGEAQVSMFLTLPVADGMDAIAELLEFHRKSSGHTKQQLGRILMVFKRTFSVLAPRTDSAARWEALERQMDLAIH